MLEGNERIRKAYKLKESFYDFVLKSKDSNQAKKEQKTGVNRQNMQEKKNLLEALRLF